MPGKVFKVLITIVGGGARSTLALTDFAGMAELAPTRGASPIFGLLARKPTGAPDYLGRADRAG